MWIVDEVIAHIHSLFTGWFSGFINWFTDPFWGWMWIVIGIWLLCLVLVKFLGDVIPFLKPVCFWILSMATFGLFAYARGAYEARKHDGR